MPVAADDDLGFVPADCAAYFEQAGALVLADLHLGRADDSNVSFPLDEIPETERRLAVLLDRFAPDEVVLAGDVLHSFSRVPSGVKKAVARLQERIVEAGSSLVTVRGNHDTMLPSIEDPVSHHVLSNGDVVCHGHEKPTVDADRYIVGHEHPAITIEGRRRPCYLLGRSVYEGADVLALPAFSKLAAGTTVNGLQSADPSSPFLAEIDDFRVIVLDPNEKDIFAFPALGNLREHL